MSLSEDLKINQYSETTETSGMKDLHLKDGEFSFDIEVDKRIYDGFNHMFDVLLDICDATGEKRLTKEELYTTLALSPQELPIVFKHEHNTYATAYITFIAGDFHIRYKYDLANSMKLKDISITKDGEEITNEGFIEILRHFCDKWMDYLYKVGSTSIKRHLDKSGYTNNFHYAEMSDFDRPIGGLEEMYSEGVGRHSEIMNLIFPTEYFGDSVSYFPLGNQSMRNTEAEDMKLESIKQIQDKDRYSRMISHEPSDDMEVCISDGYEFGKMLYDYPQTYLSFMISPDILYHYKTKNFIDSFVKKRDEISPYLHETMVAIGGGNTMIEHIIFGLKGGDNVSKRFINSESSPGQLSLSNHVLEYFRGSRKQINLCDNGTTSTMDISENKTVIAANFISMMLEDRDIVFFVKDQIQQMKIGDTLMLPCYAYYTPEDLEGIDDNANLLNYYKFMQDSIEQSASKNIFDNHKEAVKYILALRGHSETIRRSIVHFIDNNYTDKLKVETEESVPALDSVVSVEEFLNLQRKRIAKGYDDKGIKRKFMELYERNGSLVEDFYASFDEDKGVTSLFVKNLESKITDEGKEYALSLKSIFPDGYWKKLYETRSFSRDKLQELLSDIPGTKLETIVTNGCGHIPILRKM